MSDPVSDPVPRIARLLTGEGLHARTADILDALPPDVAGRRERGTASPFEHAWHLDWWQRWLLAKARGETPEAPATAAETWPGRPAPAGAGEWDALVRGILDGIDEARALAADEAALARRLPGGAGVRDALESLSGHNAYHLGQIVLLRRLAGAWPPPGGGDTW